jgi:F-box domain
MKEANLSLMPSWIIRHILNFLGPTSLLKIYQTSKNNELLAIVRDPAWWEQYYLYLQEFSIPIQSLPFGDFVPSIQNDTLAEAESIIILKIVGSEEANKWPNLENFFNYLKEEKDNQLPENYFNEFKNRVIVTLNKYLVCKKQKQQDNPQDYKSITILSTLEKQLREYLAFISCFYLLRSRYIIGGLKLIMGKNIDKALTGNDLVLLSAYTNDKLIGHLFSDFSNLEHLNLLNKLTASDWSTLINNHPSKTWLNSFILARAIVARVLTPDLDKTTINTLVRYISDSDNEVIFDNPKYSPLIDKEFMQHIKYSISISQKKEKKDEGNSLKTETTKLKFWSDKEETEHHHPEEIGQKDVRAMKVNNLSSMPSEIILHILNFLGPISLLKICQISKNNEFLAYMRDSELWKEYYLYLQKRSLPIQLLPFCNFVSSIQNNTLAEAERNIVAKIVGSEKTEWPNLENFFKYLKKEKDNRLPENYFDELKNCVIVTLNKYLICKKQQGSCQDYKSIIILPVLEKKLGEYLAIISCFYLLRGKPELKEALNLIMEDHDEILTGNSLLLLSAYTNDKLIRFLLSSQDRELLNLLKTLTASDWSNFTNKRSVDISRLNISSLINALNAGHTPDLDRATLKTLVGYDPYSFKVIIDNPNYSSLIDKEFMQDIKNCISSFQKSEKEDFDKANCLKAETTKLTFWSNKKETEHHHKEVKQKNVRALEWLTNQITTLHGSIRNKIPQDDVGEAKHKPITYLGKNRG